MRLRRHLLGVAALLGPAAASVLLLQVPAATAADSDFSSPAEGVVIGGGATSVDVVAAVPACPKNILGNCSSTPKTTLTVSAATGQLPPASKTAAKTKQTVTVTVPAGLANGTWTATLSGGNSGTRTFTTNFAPAAPTDVTAQGTGARDVAFAWTKGSEPDLTGYTLTDGSGTVIDAGITPASANCSSSTSCSYALYYPADNPGTHDYQLIAKRSSGGCATCGGSTVSSSGTPASATLTAPTPTPGPTAGPSSSPGAGGAKGSSTGGTSGGSSGGTAGKPGAKATLPPSVSNPVVSSRNFALSFHAFSPSLGIPKLPPLPATTLPGASAEQPLPMGTYKPSLPYSPQTETTKSTSILSQPLASFRQVVGVDSAQLAKSIAAAMILLLVGAHLRRYLGTHADE
ncbi:MAG: hypothetical protein JWM02_895 [Frankiales bacterium]|nr:hypothetical protein [Frankiales bacterium]